MLKVKRRVANDEVARRGRALYARRVRPRLTQEKKGRVVAMDIKTGDFAVADHAYQAARKLRARRPGAEIWLERIGFRTFSRIGAWHREDSGE